MTKRETLGYLALWIVGSTAVLIALAYFTSR
jgi:hypothetical protein